MTKFVHFCQFFVIVTFFELRQVLSRENLSWKITCMYMNYNDKYVYTYVFGPDFALVFSIWAMIDDH